MASLQWTDADVVKLCGAIATGKLVKLEILASPNQIGDAGVAALAEVAGKLPQLETRLAQPDWRRRFRARRWWKAPHLYPDKTRLATPVSPRSRRRRVSCRNSRDSVPSSTPSISQQAKDALKGPQLNCRSDLLICG